MSDEILKDVVEQVKKYCLEKIEPTAEADDESSTFRKELYTGLGELGVAGMTIPDEFGGADLGIVELCGVLEEIAKYSVSYSVTLSVSTMVQNIINAFGTSEQKKKFLPELTSGQEIGSFCLSESGSGSDAAALKTKARLNGDHYVLNGTKMWITSAGVAKYYLVMARTGDESSKGISAFVVPADAPGLSFGKKERKMGWKVSPTREVILENCQVPKENILGQEGEGFKVALSGLDKGRITIASIANGLAQRALDEAVKYSLERKQFKQQIFDFQGIQFMLADMATELEASKALVEKASRQFDSQNYNPMLASMAKLKATDMAMKVTTDAVQILGGVGYTAEFPVERCMRDAKVLQIVEGTNQIQKVVIARALKKDFQ